LPYRPVANGNALEVDWRIRATPVLGIDVCREGGDVLQSRGRCGAKEDGNKLLAHFSPDEGSALEGHASTNLPCVRLACNIEVVIAIFGVYREELLEAPVHSSKQRGVRGRDRKGVAEMQDGGKHGRGEG